MLISRYHSGKVVSRRNAAVLRHVVAPGSCVWSPVLWGRDAAFYLSCGVSYTPTRGASQPGVGGWGGGVPLFLSRTLNPDVYHSFSQIVVQRPSLGYERRLEDSCPPPQSAPEIRGLFAWLHMYGNARMCIFPRVPRAWQDSRGTLRTPQHAHACARHISEVCEIAARVCLLNT